MVRPNDQFWGYVEEMNDGLLKCKFCANAFAVGTSISRIKFHLARVEGRGVKICTEVTADVQQAACQAIRCSKSKRKSAPISSNNVIIDKISNPMQDQNNESENVVREEEMAQGQPLSPGGVAWMESLIGGEIELIEEPRSPGQLMLDAPETRLRTDVGNVVERNINGISASIMKEAVLSSGMENMSRGLMQSVERGSSSETPAKKQCRTRRYAFRATKLVGQMFERNMKDIWVCLLKDDISCIGIYGMGGAGKTTLVTHIYNQLLDRPDIFYHVYWITVSQDFSIYKLQSLIAEAIGLDISRKKDVKIIAAELSAKFIEKQKYVLILDDLWNHFLLDNVGIPFRMDGCKLILTTRSLEICRRIDCQSKIKVEPLFEEEAWKLFMERLGYDVELPPEVKPIAKSIVKECAGLPLGILAMAGSMKVADDICEWRNALQELRVSKARQDDMEPEVFRILKFSYIHLNDPALQQCFLYCALFPEDFRIEREDLIEYLIVEGMLEGIETRQGQVDKGHTMLNKLENASLLEGCMDKRYVKMHDLIRDMALQELRMNSMAIIEAGQRLVELPCEETWTKNLIRVSLMKNGIKGISSRHMPSCPHLSTLLLCRNRALSFIADSFFLQLHGLKVLDLSDTIIGKLPDSVSDLVSLTALLLRMCPILDRLPSLKNLRELKKLDLKRAGLQELPQGIEVLSKLRYLNLCGTHLQKLPTGILPNLCHLQYLRLPLAVRGEEVACLRKLETLECHFSDLTDFNKYLKNREHGQLLSAYYFVIGPESGLDNLWDYRITPEQKLTNGIFFHDLRFCRKDLLGLPEDIERLTIVRCQCARSLCGVYPLEHLTKLRGLSICLCNELESLLLLSSFSYSVLKNLEVLSLEMLENIQVLIDRKRPPSHPLPSNRTFSCLKRFEVDHCPSMKNLFPPSLLPNLQNLEVINIEYCENMEEIIAMKEEAAAGIMGKESSSSSKPSVVTNVEFSLPKLTVLRLRTLQKLKSIYYGKLICNSLKEIAIIDCQELKRIPLSLPLLDNGLPSPHPSLKQISVSPYHWWESVNWDNANAKDALRHIVA